MDSATRTVDHRVSDPQTLLLIWITQFPDEMISLSVVEHIARRALNSPTIQSFLRSLHDSEMRQLVDTVASQLLIRQFMAILRHKGSTPSIEDLGVWERWRCDADGYPIEASPYWAGPSVRAGDTTDSKRPASPSGISPNCR